MSNRRAKLEEAYSVQQEEWSAAVRMNWFSTVETRPWWTEAIASDHSSLKASNTDRVFIQRVWGDGDVYVTSRSLIVWPLSESLIQKGNKEWFLHLLLSGFVSSDPIYERLLSELAEDNQTRLVSACAPSPGSLIQDWAAWQGILHLRNELTGGVERLLRGKAKAQKARIILT